MEKEKSFIDVYNQCGNLSAASKILGISKSTLQRRLISSGYIYNSKLKKYVLGETINNVSNEINNNVSRETFSNDDLIQGSYTISSDLSKALKLKAVLEQKKVVDIVRHAIESSVEQKYFDLTKNI